MEEVEGALENDVDEPNFEEFDDEAPPEVSEEELLKIDLESDKVEVERLVAMGPQRLRPQEDRNQYDFLTTKVVRDWRKRPRSRLVAREFKTSAFAKEPTLFKNSNGGDGALFYMRMMVCLRQQLRKGKL